MMLCRGCHLGLRVAVIDVKTETRHMQATNLPQIPASSSGREQQLLSLVISSTKLTDHYIF